MGFFLRFYIIELTGRLTVFFGNFAIKPLADVVSSTSANGLIAKTKSKRYFIISPPPLARLGRGSIQQNYYNITEIPK